MRIRLPACSSPACRSCSTPSAALIFSFRLAARASSCATSPVSKVLVRGCQATSHARQWPPPESTLGLIFLEAAGVSGEERNAFKRNVKVGVSTTPSCHAQESGHGLHSEERKSATFDPHNCSLRRVHLPRRQCLDPCAPSLGCSGAAPASVPPALKQTPPQQPAQDRKVIAGRCSEAQCGMSVALSTWARIL